MIFLILAKSAPNVCDGVLIVFIQSTPATQMIWPRMSYQIEKNVFPWRFIFAPKYALVKKWVFEVLSNTEDEKISDVEFSNK